MARVPLVTVLLKDQVLQQHALDKPIVKIGRHRACDIVLDNPAVSRVHATISAEQGELHVQDNGSSNGVQLNGEPVTRASLKSGDVIRIGKFTLHVSIPDEQQNLVGRATHWGRDLTFRVAEERPKK